MKPKSISPLYRVNVTTVTQLHTPLNVFSFEKEETRPRSLELLRGKIDYLGLANGTII